jgi:hypothetical protein
MSAVRALRRPAFPVARPARAPVVRRQATPPALEPLSAIPTIPGARSLVEIEGLMVEVDYSTAIRVRDGELADRIAALIDAFAGAGPELDQAEAIAALGSGARRWLLFALQLHLDNASAAPSLNAAEAVWHLLARAPHAEHPPLADPDNLFVDEALRISGWLESALADRMRRPNDIQVEAVQDDLKLPPSKARTRAELDVPQFRKRMKSALSFLVYRALSHRPDKLGADPIEELKPLGDLIVEEARTYFAPYAEAARRNVFSLGGWKASENTYAVESRNFTEEDRVQFLIQRGFLVGGNTDRSAGRFNDANIFADTGFDSARPSDRQVLREVALSVLETPGMSGLVDVMVRHTGRMDDESVQPRIGLSIEYDAETTTACRARWGHLRTLCHEVLHAMAHSNFNAAGWRVPFDQIVWEGFPEVLGVELFNERIVPKASSAGGAPGFKARLEAGIDGAPCPDPDATKVDYGLGGVRAARIEGTIGRERFRAAFFLGRPELAGLPR